MALDPTAQLASLSAATRQAREDISWHGRGLAR
jgi:hypothetical protein